ncbi:4-(cytidine 5'-diphospho)-2-C-methyl-D-erythritol kinase [Lachnoclostridium sp. Marseille-P6806]|uniref:4-(cytidine 5'-diphospho)-2-C-methyl-D-erythritol kinase n=1 Tax=Lachnoclostridium sp. Marseille-P6806 TaxID=2364793 RepID=UPI00102F5A8C|nr:4-(cytidine 5'-diphospho)-2-C-methyl-D-erythritol kinase [Lachnoclostridium sp. Marseille-P6806]
MLTTVRKAYAKINLGLDVVGRREDGYHLVDMIMQTVGIYDTLVFRSTGRALDAKVKLSISGSSLPSGEDNLIVRAVRIMQARYDIREGIDIELTKRIPVAAGMAGGSTDAAAAFLALRDMFAPDVTEEELQEAALPLGADIPYCIVGGTRRAEGIGERLTCLCPAPDCRLIIVKPDIDVPTAWVYRTLDELADFSHPDIPAQIKAIEAGDVKQMIELSGNVLETVTAARFDVIGRLERFLEERGAVRAVMTGSGPAVFAVFTEEGAAEAAFGALCAHPEFGGFERFLTGFVRDRDGEASADGSRSRAL